MSLKNLFLSLLLFFAIAGCKKIQDPDFRRIQNFRVKKLGFEKTTVGFEVTYFNPNNFRVNVKKAALDIFMDSVFLGRFQQDSAIAVSPKAEFTIPLSGDVLMKTALQLNLQDMASREVDIKADGNVKVGKAGIYINKAVHYEGRHRLDEIKF